MITSSSHIINKSRKTNITNYQGNIRQVVNPDGEVLQDNHYYPFGMLMGESSDIVAANLPQGHFTDGGGNRFRYGAKELITTGGVNLSDYTARFLDHATLRFLTPDPLREKYTSMSSYLYCGANPVMFIDPTGMVVEYVGTEDEIRELKELVQMLLTSQLFEYIFSALENSEEVFTLEAGEAETESGEKRGGGFSDSKITIDIKSDLKAYAMAEECAHAWQTITPDNTVDNIEYEAKVAANIIMQESIDEIYDRGLYLTEANMSRFGESVYPNMRGNRYFISDIFDREYMEGARFFIDGVNEDGETVTGYLIPIKRVSQRLKNALKLKHQTEKEESKH